MSVDTKKIRAYIEDYASLVGRDHMLKDTMGVRGAALVELLDVYEAAKQVVEDDDDYGRVLQGDLDKLKELFK
jgi:hypothetical protein